MADFSEVFLTTAGKDIKARCETGEQLIYTRAGLGDGQINTDDEAIARASLVNERFSVPVYDLSFVGNGEVRLKFAYTNAGLTEGFFLREIGIYVQDLDNPAAEVLYSITYAPTEPDHIAPEALCPVERLWVLNIYIGNASNVTAVFNNLEIIGVKVLKYFITEADANGNSLFNLPWSWNPQLDNLTLYIDGVLQSRSGGQWGPSVGAELSTSCNQVQFPADLSGVINGIMFVSLPLDGAQDISAMTTHIANLINPHQVTKSQVGLGNVDNVQQIPMSEKGITVAELVAGKIPTAQLPDSIVGQVEYKGTWDASTNTPALGNAGVGGDKGHYFKVSVAGSSGIDGVDDWAVGDWIIHNGSTWDKVDNTDKIASELQKGIVALATIPETLEGLDTAKAVTPAGVKAACDNSMGVGANQYGNLSNGGFIRYGHMLNGQFMWLNIVSSSAGNDQVVLPVGYRPPLSGGFSFNTELPAYSQDAYAGLSIQPDGTLSLTGAYASGSTWFLIVPLFSLT